MDSGPGAQALNREDLCPLSGSTKKVLSPLKIEFPYLEGHLSEVQL